MMVLEPLTPHIIMTTTITATISALMASTMMTITTHAPLAEKTVPSATGAGAMSAMVAST